MTFNLDTSGEVVIPLDHMGDSIGHRAYRWPDLSPFEPEGMERTLQTWFGVPIASARIANALFAASGWLTRDDLVAASGRTINGMHLSLKLLRAAMEPDSVEYVTGHGYRLTEAGRADCGAGLAERAAA